MNFNIFKLTIFINLLSGINCLTDCKKFLLHPDFLDDEKQPLLSKLFSKTSSCFASHKQTHQIAISNNINDLKNYFKDFSWIGPFEVTNNENGNRIGLFFKAIMIPPTSIFEHKDDIGKIFNDDLCSLEDYFLPDYHQSNDIIDKQIMKTGLAKFSILDKTKLLSQFAKNFTEICDKTGCMVKYDDDFAVLHKGKIKKLSYWKEGTYVPLKAVCQSQLLTCEDGYRANFETFICDEVCKCNNGEAAIGKDQGCLEAGDNACFYCFQDYELNGKFCRLPNNAMTNSNEEKSMCVTAETCQKSSSTANTVLNVKLIWEKNSNRQFRWFNITLNESESITILCYSGTDFDNVKLKHVLELSAQNSVKSTDKSAAFYGRICFGKYTTGNGLKLKGSKRCARWNTEWCWYNSCRECEWFANDPSVEGCNEGNECISDRFSNY